MKLYLAIALVALALVLPLSAAYDPPDGSTKGVVSGRSPEDITRDANEEALYEADPTTNVVDHEPNNGCASAYDWPVRTNGLTKGKLTTEDSQDWSEVLLFRTESVSASTPRGVVKLETSKDCDSDLLVGGAVVDVAENGWVPLLVSTSDTFEAYHLEYKITQNDAETNADLPNYSAGAFTINALPEDMNPRDFDRKTGSLSFRADDIEPDVDWFRINTGLAQVPKTENADPKELNLGLLTVSFNSDCYLGERGFTLFEADETTKIQETTWGCGPMLRSCIAASFSTVYAKLEQERQEGGAGYDFFAAIAPLAVVNLEDGNVETTVLDPGHVWCDPLTPRALAAAAQATGESWGVMDKYGRLVAKVNNGSP